MESETAKRGRGRPRKYIKGECRDCLKSYNNDNIKDFYIPTWCKECRNEYMNNRAKIPEIREQLSKKALESYHAKAH